MANFYTLLANLPACSSFMRRAGSHQNWKTWGRIQRLEGLKRFQTMVVFVIYFGLILVRRIKDADVVIKLLDKNDFDLICQGHQVVEDRFIAYIIFLTLLLTFMLLSTLSVYEAHLGYIIEDVHPNGGIKKIKSSVYSNLSYTFQFIISFRLRYISTGSPIQSFSKLREAARGHLSRLQGIWSPCSDQVAVELNTHSCCMCGRTHSCCKAADSVGTSPEPTTKKPVRCNNLE
uniref:Uncharacterized protein n=1 Tax=Brassica oleracea var. oleracea TaxID=109376 RepID=A0A0D3AQV3_BRAOL